MLRAHAEDPRRESLGTRLVLIIHAPVSKGLGTRLANYIINNKSATTDAMFL